jgi:hypothetical protein
MNQSLHARLVPINSTNEYNWQCSQEQLQYCISSVRRNRNRGIILSRQGWQKLIQAGVLYNDFGERYTYEQLSERTCLNERTVSRLLSCEVKVDKNTLKTFFCAFNLLLEASDYISSKSDEASYTTLDASIHTASTMQQVEFEQLVEELTQLKQRLRDYDRLLQQLGLKENYINQQMRA